MLEIIYLKSSSHVVFQWDVEELTLLIKLLLTESKIKKDIILVDFWKISLSNNLWDKNVYDKSIMI